MHREKKQKKQSRLCASRGDTVGDARVLSQNQDPEQKKPKNGFVWMTSWHILIAFLWRTNSVIKLVFLTPATESRQSSTVIADIPAI